MHRRIIFPSSGSSLHESLRLTRHEPSSCCTARKSEGRLRFRKRPSYLDGGKPNSVGVITHADDHLSHSATRTSGGTPSEFSFAVMRRYPRIKRTGCPPSVLSCTAWGFSCLAHYSASGELVPRLFTLACASFKEPAVSFL